MSPVPAHCRVRLSACGNLASDPSHSVRILAAEFKFMICSLAVTVQVGTVTVTFTGTVTFFRVFEILGLTPKNLESPHFYLFLKIMILFL